MVVRLDLAKKQKGVGGWSEWTVSHHVEKNTQHPSVVSQDSCLTIHPGGLVITLIERTLPFKSHFTCQIIKSANRGFVPDQIPEL